MPRTQVDALSTIVHHLSELVEQLKIANQLKAWELKKEYCSSLPALYDGSDAIDKIMKDE